MTYFLCGVGLKTYQRLIYTSGAMFSTNVGRAITSYLFHFSLFSDVLYLVYCWTVMEENVQ